MLNLFTLYTFKMIFSSLDKELSSYAQMLYINCLIYHFEDLEISEKNSHGFKVYKSEMKINITAKGFVELEKSGLISIQQDHVVFNNVWGQHIDRSALTNSLKDDLINSITGYSDKLLESVSTQEYVLMKHKIKPENYESLVKSFISEQKALKKCYNDLNDVTRHFYYWVGKNKNNVESKGKSTTILGM